MKNNSEIDRSTLGWVKKELDETLKQAAEALEEYAEDSSDATQLRFCATYLHQVAGTLQMLELFGAAMVAEEMEHLADALLQDNVSNRDETYEVLMRAILQVPDYLERVQGGYQDSPILVLPLLNDLRAARGANLLTESVLFSPDLDAVGEAPRYGRDGSGATSELARKERHRYQLALLSYLRGRDAKGSLERLREVLDQLDSAAGTDQAGNLWWIAGGLADAMERNDLEASSAAKMLLGQVDRQIKRVIDHGEEPLLADPPKELLKNLLFYVGQAEPHSDRVRAIQEQFQLKGLLPNAEHIQRAREGSFGPGAEILGTVAEAIKEDLVNVKDALDLFVRGGQSDLQKLESVTDSLHRVADTLGMLGLGVARKVVKDQVHLVRDMAEGNVDADELQLMHLAKSLLYVESSLEGLISRPTGAEAGELTSQEPELPEGEVYQLSEQELFDLEYRRVYTSAVNEAVADVAAAKEAITGFSDSRDHEVLAPLPDLFDRLQGALRMLDLERAADVLHAVARYVRSEVLESGAVPESEALDALADAITSLEYYLEGVLEKRGELEGILEVAQASVSKLGYTVEERPAEPEQAEADQPEPEVSAEAVPEPAEAATPEQPEADASAVEEPAPASRRIGSAASVNFDVAVMADELEEEIMEVFLEEVEEVMETIHQELPKWRSNHEDTEALTTIRRMFHTLKGSGRLAGALLLGELAWSIERLLNRVLEGNVEVTNDLQDVLDRAVEAFPGLVTEIQGGPPPEADVRWIMRKADILTDPARSGELAELGEPGSAAAEETPSEAASALEELAPGEEAEDAGESIELAGGLEYQGDDTAAEAEWDALDLEVGAEEDVLGLSEETAADRVDHDTSMEEAPEPVEDEPLEGEEIELSGGLEAPLETEEEAFADLAEGGPEELEVTDLGEAEDLSAGPAMDEVLYEIFSKEARDHLDAINEFIAQAREANGDSRVSEGLIRALHTLTGSARMANVHPIAELGRKMEILVQIRHEAGSGLDAEELELLARGAALVDEIVTALGEAGAALPDVEPLTSELQGRAAASAEIGDSEAEPEPEPEAAIEPPAPVEAEQPAEPQPLPSTIDADLVDLFLEEAEDILRFLETTVERWEDQPEHGATIAELHRSLHTLKGGARLAGFDTIGALCHSLESVSGDVAEHRVPADDAFFNTLHRALDQLAAMIATARKGLLPPLPEGVVEDIRRLQGAAVGGSRAEEPAQTDDVPPDAELTEVFLEEASEILEGTENTLQSWMEAPDDSEILTELQRALHTLKGGARMAGFPPIANLSHALETLLIAILNGRAEASQPVFELLELCHDRLYGMREKAAAGQPVAEADDLLEQIEILRSGGAPKPPTPDGGAPVPAPESKAGKAEPKADAEPEPEQKPKTGGREDAGARMQHDQVRVRADLLDNLVNYAGEVSIYRARLEQQVGAFRFNLAELDQTVDRLRDQLRTMDIETEAQILYRFEREHEGEDQDEDFDPLELDRFSRIQELSRGLSESVNDLGSIQGMLDNLSRESETLLLQQSRVNTEMQDGLMRTRMVPFANLVPRMRRIVRQTTQELGKAAQLKVTGAQGEMDRTVLERVIPPLEHMLRNAVAHGIETPEQRAKAGKPEGGTITVALDREGADVLMRVSDDGSGMNLEAIRKKALERGLLREDVQLTDREIMQFVLESGFSTAEEVTQIAGRGVGMDVVNAEIKQLGGNLEIESEAGRGTAFVVRLPFTLAINQALLCTAGDDAYAIPLTSIEGVVRMTHEELSAMYDNSQANLYDYAGQAYEVMNLSALLGTGEPQLPGEGKRLPVILVQTGDHRLALQVDGLLGNREIVVKSVGAQISTVPGIFGATILADGRVVLILEVGALVRIGAALQEPDTYPELPEEEEPEARGRPVIMVVDDSITMRKVATRLLERNNMDVITAKDGVDAVANLQEQVPDAMLLDIEMPRMDGYELATHMRNDERLKSVPIIMITSRTGEKHRKRAMDIGVNRYLGKPYQESELLENLNELLEEQRGRGR